MISDQEKIDYIKAQIGHYKDFPKAGTNYCDIFTALTDAKTCLYLKQLLVKFVRENYSDADLIVGLDSRGFLFNLMVAAEVGIGATVIRKKGKLPGEILSVEYELEYGTDIFELQKCAVKPGQKVVLMDDLLATGGSLTAAIELVQKAGGIPLGVIVVMELMALEGRKKLGCGCNVRSLITY